MISRGLLVAALTISNVAFAEQAGLPPIPAPLASTQTAANQQTDIQAAIATAPDQLAANSGKTIEEQADAYIEANGFAAREQRGEISVLRGFSIVDVPSTSPQWVAQRSLAYDAALLDAQADYVLKRSAQITASITSDLLQAADRDPPPFKTTDNDTSKAGELIRKLMALGGAELDKALRELNINPADYEKAAQPQRYVQMHAALTQKITTTAFGQLVGLMPVQTFEKPLGSGVYKVGVVAVISPRMKDFAQRVLTERGNFAPDLGHAGKLADIVADKSSLVRDFGVRWRYDEAGLPVIVSFSQWSSEYRGQDPMLGERYKDIAFKQAEQRADAQIADFLKGSVNVQNTTEVSRELTEAADRMPDGYIAQQAAVAKLLNGYQSSIRRRSEVSITGLSTLSRWTAKHPETEQTIIGVVRIWSAAGERSTRALTDGRTSAPPAAGATLPASGPGAGQSGRKLIDATDF